jgi:hypothetical protein
VGGGSNDFSLIVGLTLNTTYVLDRTYTSGRYTLELVDGDATYDIYAIAEDGTYAGYTNGAAIEVFADFAEVVVLGASSSETIVFSYQGTLTVPSTAGDVTTAGAFVSNVVTSSLPGIDGTTVVNGGNFASDVTVSFIDQSNAETSAKSVVRSSSTQLIATRPDVFSPDNSPYTLKVVNPGIPVPSGSNAHLLVDSVTAGTNPAWQTTGDIFYNIGAATGDVTLLATDSEGTDIDYSVVSGTLPAGITLDGETGVLSGTFSGSASEGDSNSVTFKAIDTGGNFLNKTFSFIANAAPVWTTASNGIEDAAPDTAYSFQLVASGGSAGGTLSYALVAGALHAGLSLSTTGLISGTNTDPNESDATFTVRVSDTGGTSADREFTSTVLMLEVTGGVITQSGGYFYHTFLSSGNLNNPFENLAVSVYAISGGGSASTSYHGGGGGGAGGFSEANETLAAGDYVIAVGAGASTTTSTNATATKGNSTTISILNTNIPGGGGGVTNWVNAAVGDGASGGGACNISGNVNWSGSGINGLGKNGGSSVATDLTYAGGGGGGFSVAGQNSQSVNYGGTGGSGTSQPSLAAATGTGDSGYYCGGGAGGIDGQAVGAGYGNEVQGGSGGGGDSGVWFGTPDGHAGLVNTGGGGGAPCSKGSGDGGAGGSGLVIFRYLESAVA